MNQRKFAGVGAFLLVGIVTGGAEAAFTSTGQSGLSFSVGGPAGLTISGTGGGVKVSESDGTLRATSRVSQLKTGMSLRDQHMLRYLHAAEHPEAVLTVKRSSLTVPGDGESKTSTGQGEFTLNGQTHPLSFRYKATHKEGRIVVSALGDIDITKWGIEKPCLALICTDTIVKIKVGFSVKDE